ncbi:MAG TPA: ABC transporter permease [Acidimicrobiia bacterium]|jgi:ABC-type transport system involved in multi-copper enzyme maturation permease subunit
MITLLVHFFRRMMTKGRVIGLIALSSVAGLVIWLSSGSDLGGDDAVYPFAVTTAGFTFAIAILILTVGTLRDERDAGTLPYLYMKPVPRTRFAAASISGGAATAIVIGVGAWLATVLGSMAGGVDLSHAIPGLALFVTAAIGYAAIFVPLGYLAPRSLLFGLGYVVVLEQVVGSLINGVAQLSIWRIAVSIYADLAPTVPDEVIQGVLGSVAPGVGGGLAKLAGALVLGWLVLTWALRQRDAI